MMNDDFDNVSLRGRIAYGIMCAENLVLTSHPNRDWKPVFAELWKITGSVYWDDWSDRVMDLLPETIYALDSYDPDEFSWLSEDGFAKLKSLYSNMPACWSFVMQSIVDMEEAYAYTSIPGNGAESIELLKGIAESLAALDIELPDKNAISSFSFEANGGRGDCFDAKPLSKII